jgi:hypothetical protein
MNRVFAPYRIVICGLSGFTLIPKLSQKRRSFRKKKKILNIKFVFCLKHSLSYEEFWKLLSCYVHRSSSKLVVILVIFQINLNFLGIFSKYPQISSLVKIQRVGAELFHVDRRTDEQTVMTKL